MSNRGDDRRKVERRNGNVRRLKNIKVEKDSYLLIMLCFIVGL